MNDRRKKKSQLIDELKDARKQLGQIQAARKQNPQNSDDLNLLSSVFTQCKEGCCVAGLNGGILFINDAFAGMHGYTPRELEGKNLSIFHTREQMQIVNSTNKLIVEKGEFKGEIRHVHRDGGEFPTYMHNSLFNDANGKPFGIIGTIHDLTEISKKVGVLKASEERFRNIIEQAGDAIFILTPEGGVVDVNGAACNNLGYKHEELLRMSVSDFELKFPETDNSRKVWNLLSPGDTITLEGVHKRNDGTTFPVEVRIGQLGSPDEELMIAIARDITERKESEDRFKLAAQTASDLIYEWNVEDDSLSWFGNIDKALGYERGEFEHSIKAWLRVIHPEDRNRIADAVESLRNSTKPFKYEYRIRGNDGSWRCWMERGAPILDDNGKLRKYVGVCTDITERKIAEIALRESERRFRSLVEASPDAITLTDFEGRILKVNRKAAELHGYENADDMMDDVLYAFDLMNIKDHENAGRIFQSVLNDGKARKAEHSFIRKDGSVFAGELRTALIKDAEDNPAGFVSITRDISERKWFENLTMVQKELAIRLMKTSDLEEALKFSLEAVIRASGMDSGGVYLYNPDNGGLYLSHHVGLSEFFVARASEFPLDSPNTQLVLKGEPIHNAFNELTFPMSNIELVEGLKAISVIPLKHEDRILGCLNVASHTLKSIPDNNKNAIEAIGAEIGGIIARIQAEDMLQASEERYRNLLENLIDGIGLVDMDETFMFANPAAEKIFWNPEGGLAGNNLRKFVTEQDFIRLQNETKKRAGKKKSNIYELEIFNDKGKKKHLLVSVSPHLNKDGEMIGAFAVLRDMSDYKNLEAQYLQAQKMESIGRLAGGLAHDFNNLLTGIIGNTDLALSSLDAHDPLYQDLIEVYKSAERASDLTRQLLAFSRKQVLEPRVVNVNRVISRMEKMLRRLIGEDILLKTKSQDESYRIKVDPGQMEQVILNLAVNARDAMPEGGRLLIVTGMKVYDQRDEVRYPDLISGPHARLTISDNGIGMDEETKMQIFDPFFTTKEMGKGTGLGLSTVYGIVKQSGGQISVYSEPGKGTTFTILFPLVTDNETVELKDRENQKMPRGDESVLVIEDDPSVRNMAVRVLKLQGYRVYEANSGGEALIFCERQNRPVDLIVSDVVMPNMNGPEFIERIQTICVSSKI